MRIRRLIVRSVESANTLGTIANWLNTVSVSLLAYIVINMAARVPKEAAGSPKEAAKVPTRAWDLLKDNPETVGILVLLVVSIVLGMVYLLRVGLTDPARRVKQSWWRYLFGNSEGWILVIQSSLLIFSAIFAQVSGEKPMEPHILHYLPEAPPPKPPPPPDASLLEAIARMEMRVAEIANAIERFRGDVRRAEYDRQLVAMRMELEGLKVGVAEMNKDVRGVALALANRIERGMGDLENGLKGIERAIVAVGPVHDYRGDLRDIREKIVAVRAAVEGLRPALEGLRLERSGVRER